MKNVKKISVLVVGLLASIFMVGCSCSDKPILPTEIVVDIDEKILFVGDSFDVGYEVLPSNAEDISISVTANKNGVVSIGNSSLSGVRNKTSITATKIDELGVTVTFKVAGSDLTDKVLVKVLPDPTQIVAPASAPQFNNENGTISFLRVNAFDNYLLNINGTDYKVADETASSTINFNLSENNVSLKLNEVNTVKVKVIGDGIEYADSEFSTEFKFIKLDSLKNVQVNNGVFSWTPHSLNQEYSVEINGVLQTVTLTENNFTLPTQAGVSNYTVKLRAVSTSGTHNGVVVYASDYVTEYTINVLSNPTLSIVNTEEGVALSNGYVNIEPVEHATSYLVSVLNGADLVKTYSTTTTKIEIDSEFLAGVEYTIKVEPIGEDASTIKGAANSINVTKLSSPSSAVILNNSLMFVGVLGTSQYAIEFTDGNTVKQVLSGSTTVNLQTLLTEEGTYQISIKAIGNTLVNTVNSASYQSSISLSKLGQPIISKISNDGTISFNTVANATTYDVYLNGTYLNSTSTNSYKIDLSTLSAGDHQVYVVAMGDGVSTISSTIAGSEFNFKKLSAITNYSVTNDQFVFDGVSDAQDYYANINGGEFVLLGNNDGSQVYIPSQIVNGTNTINVYAVGNNQNIVNSDEATFAVDRMAAPQNLQVLNGVVVWNSQANAKYFVYLNDSNSYTEVAGTSFVDYGDVLSGTIKVKAVANSGNAFSSEFSTFKFSKLNTVNSASIKIENLTDITNPNTDRTQALVWDDVENASNYSIYLTNQTTSQVTGLVAVSNFEEISSRNLEVGSYLVQIIAKGSSATSGIGYVNSQVAEFSFEVLEKPTNLTHSFNTISFDALPQVVEGYLIKIVDGGLQEFVFVNDTQYAIDYTKYSSSIEVSVKALGVNNLANGSFSDALTIEKQTAASSLAVTNGNITFLHTDADAGFDVYVAPAGDTDFVLTNSIVTGTSSYTAVLPDLLSGQYEVYVVAKNENKLSSINSGVLSFEKLQQVQNLDFNKNTSQITYDANANASKYVITQFNNKMEVVNTTETDLLTYTVPDLNGGTYSFGVVAVGNSANYVSSNMSLVTFTVLHAPTSATIENNILTVVSNNPVSNGYTFVITDKNNNTQNLSSTGNTLNLSQISFSSSIAAGELTIDIYSKGNSELVPSYYPLTINTEKIDSNAYNLRIENGTIKWDNTNGLLADVYVDGSISAENVSGTTAEILNVQNNTAYNVTVVFKHNNKISSNFSNAVQMYKLPEVTGLKINERNADMNTGTFEYYLSWNLITGPQQSNFEYQITASQNGQIISSFNPRVSAGVNEYVVDLSTLPRGEITFNIRAAGIAGGYLNSAYMVNGVVVNVLQDIEILDYNNQTNSIALTNNNQNAKSIIVTYQNIDDSSYVHYTELNYNATVYNINHPSNLPAGVYSINIYALGNIEGNVLSSAVSKKQFTILQSPTNLRLQNGYIIFTHAGDLNTTYNVYSDSEFLFSASDLNGLQQLNTLLTDFEEHRITVVAVKDGAINSQPSNAQVVTKLNTATNLRFENSKIVWNTVNGASGYVVYNVNEEINTDFESHPNYSSTFNGIYVAGLNAGLTGVELPKTIAVGTYEFVVMAVGGTTSQSDYLTGELSEKAAVTIIENVTGVNSSNGVLTWNEVAGAKGYELNISNESGYSEVVTTNLNTFDFSRSKYVGGFYDVTVTALGDGVNTLDALTALAINQTIYKPNAPSGYQIRDGFVSWKISIADPYFATVFETNDLAIIIEQLQAALLDGSSNERLQHFSNLTISINNVIYTNQTFSDYKVNLLGGEVVFYYDVPKLLEANPYTIKVMFAGNTVGSVTETPTDPDAPVDPENPEEPQEVVKHIVVNGSYSNEVVAYKLPSPSTPVSGINMVENDSLYFSTVNEVGYDIVYRVIATPNDGSDKVIYDIDSALIASKNYIVQLTGASETNYALKVPVIDFISARGVVYEVKVVVLGTADSNLNSGNNYLTSTALNTTTVELLNDVAVSVFNGEVAIDANLNAVGYELRIWSTSLGPDWLNTWYENPISKARSIIINEDSASANAFIKETGAMYQYILADNPDFEQGAYYVQAKALGNGKDTISSAYVNLQNTEGSVRTVYKAGAAVTIDMVGGEFNWDAIEFNYSGSTLEVHRYKIDVYRVIESGSGIPEFVGSVYKTAEELDADNNGLLQFDLPPTSNYSYKNGVGQVYKYYINVSGHGSVDSSEVVNNLIFVNGDTKLSEKFERIGSPENIEMVNGELTWSQVENGVTYEVSYLDVTAEEQDYVIANQGENYTFSFSGDQFSETGVINLKIRVLPGAQSLTKLKGSYSIDIEVNKLVPPSIRIENGIVKWNNIDTESDLSATSVAVFRASYDLNNNVVKGEEVYVNELVLANDAMNTDAGFDLTDLNTELSGLIDAGLYLFEVKYIGSTGAISEQTQLFSSNIDTFVVNKLNTPTLDRYTSPVLNADGSQDHFVVSAVDVNSNAAYYQFNVVKYNEGEVINSYVFEPYQVNDITKEYFKTMEITDQDGAVKRYVGMNLKAVSALDATFELEEDKFGGEYSVYVNVFDEDVSADEQGNAYGISNLSEEEKIEIPEVPTDLRFNQQTGELSWVNASDKTTTKINMTYKNEFGVQIETVTVTVDAGVNTYKIEKIGLIDITVESLITTIDGFVTSSGTTDVLSTQFVMFESGEGTDSNPYLISTVDHFKNIAHFNNKVFKLNSNVDFASETVQGYLVDAEFTGKLYGEGYSLTNLQFGNSTSVALFRQIGATGIVTNFDVELTTSNFSGNNLSIITNVNDGLISNISTNNATITYISDKSRNIASAANINNGTISNYINNVNFTYSGSTPPANFDSFVAGVVYSNNGTITNSGNNGNLLGTAVGGLVYSNAGTISNSYNRGNLTGKASSLSHRAYVGGLVVQNTRSLTNTSQVGVIENSYVNINTLSATGYSSSKAIVGGIAAVVSYGSINNTYVVIEDTLFSNVQFGIVAGSETRLNFNSNYSNINYYFGLNAGAQQNFGDKSASDVVATYNANKDSLNTAVLQLGNFKADNALINNGFAVLNWE